MKNPESGEKAAKTPRRSLEELVKDVAKRFRSGERKRHTRLRRPTTDSEFRMLRDYLGLIAAVLALLAFSVAAHASAIAQPFDEANQNFALGNYPAAIKQYEGIIARQGYSAPVLFNLGNACYRSGDLGAAILNYERAKVLAPRDNAIEANLRLAQEKAGLPVPAPNEAERAARFLSPNTLAWIGSIALATLCLAFVLKWFRPSFSKYKAVMACAILVMLTVGAAFAIRWPEFDRAIILTPKSPARIAPASAASELFALKAGEPVTAGKVHDAFVLIHTADGRAGWINEKDVGRVFSAKPLGG